MIVDASAIVAIVEGEPEAGLLAARLRASPTRLTHAISIFEAALAASRINGIGAEIALAGVRDFLADTGIGEMMIDHPVAHLAVAAHVRYGKGRHPAALNMGDCFSYACAKLRGMPLLYKGEDFAQTDLG